MTVTAPDWLVKHGGEFRRAGDGTTWVVRFDSEPQYLLRPIPTQGKHGCEIEQTINGRRLDSPATHATSDDALRGGLDALRQVLGW